MKNKILEFLQNTDEFVSGQEICDALGVSRTTVWKGINALKEEGYEIESVTRKGYRLMEIPDILNQKNTDAYLSSKDYPYPVFVYDSIDSTNEEAKRQFLKGAMAKSVFVSDQQTAGKGRRGRNWSSPKGEDIFFSILLKPEIPTDRASMLTLVAALAGVKASEKFSGEACYIKWPNDIVLHDRKICGILTEMSAEMNEISYVVIGIGFNLNRQEFDSEIAKTATSIYNETDTKVERIPFLEYFLSCFWEYYEIFLRTQDLSGLVNEYNKHLINTGRQVRLIQRSEELVRKALGINEMGELIVEDEFGNKDYIFSGEVSVRGLYGYV